MVKFNLVVVECILLINVWLKLVNWKYSCSWLVEGMFLKVLKFCWWCGLVGILFFNVFKKL